jgi:hypothetical protein
MALFNGLIEDVFGGGRYACKQMDAGARGELVGWLEGAAAWDLDAGIKGSLHMCAGGGYAICNKTFGMILTLPRHVPRESKMHSATCNNGSRTLSLPSPKCESSSEGLKIRCDVQQKYSSYPPNSRCQNFTSSTHPHHSNSKTNPPRTSKQNARYRYQLIKPQQGSNLVAHRTPDVHPGCPITALSLFCPLTLAYTSSPYITNHPRNPTTLPFDDPHEIATHDRYGISVRIVPLVAICNKI